ncbi:MAG: hypothetical protein QG597_3835 [Actinomycetota bacterium]|nr:hypothetical protein [Actinomycetota bacterium]
MSSIFLFVAVTVVSAAVVVGFGSRPWLESPARRRDELSRVVAGHRVKGVAVLASAGALAAGWLALDAAGPGGLVEQWGLLQQLLLVGLAVVWGGYLVVLPWQPLWVAEEFRRLAWILPALTATVLCAAAAMGIGSYLGALLGTAVAVLVTSLPMHVAARALVAANPTPAS